MNKKPWCVQFTGGSGNFFLDRDHVVRAFQNFYSQSLPYIGIDNPQVGGFLLGLPRPSTFDVGMEFTFGRWCGQLLKELRIQP